MVQGILNRMSTLYAVGDIGARPDTVTYGSTMSAWARIGRKDADNWPLALLNKMEDLWKSGNGDVGSSWAA